jgi:hypothetical protein
MNALLLILYVAVVIVSYKGALILLDKSDLL